MIVGSALLLMHHGAHMLWLLGPAAQNSPLAWTDVLVGVGLAVLWTAWFVGSLRQRPTFEAEKDDRP
jgi:hypothetical protein